MPLSTHILDTALGKPAARVGLVLSQLQDGTWHELARAETDSDGRCKSLLGETPLEASTYKLRFATAEYFTSQKISGLYPFVEIVFEVKDPKQHFHIPLLLTANSYTTYRGS